MLSAQDDSGKPVDWWFMYKLSGEATRSDSAARVTGDQAGNVGVKYVYFDANAAKKQAKLTISPHGVDQHEGALYHTLSQLYGPAAKANKDLGWFFYNDENPDDGGPNANKVVGSRGHTKGVLAFDLKSDAAFWLIQSTPKFPLRGRYAFPPTGMKMAQTFLCITLRNADTARQIAQQMSVAQQPNVYGASSAPRGLSATEACAMLMQDRIVAGEKPVTSNILFRSKAGQAFRAIAKNKYWSYDFKKKKGLGDFYNDLVGPALHESLEVETWENDPTPPTQESDKVHKIENMQGVDLQPLGIPYTWSEKVDHAKLAISAASEKTHWVCVGDINFTIAQEKRSGGTVCFVCDPLWQSLTRVLDSTSPVERKAGKPAKRS